MVLRQILRKLERALQDFNAFHFIKYSENHFSSATVMHIGQSRYFADVQTLCKYFTVNFSFQIETKFTERPTSMLVFIKKQFSPFLDQRLSSSSKA